MKTLLSILLLLAAFACDRGPQGVDPAEGSAGNETPPLEIPSTDLSTVVASPNRSSEHRARDVYRHPVETLTFFGLEPDMRVLEVRPGGGWYTEILAPHLRTSGTLVVGVPSAEGRRAKYRARFLEMQAERPEVFGAVEVVTFDPPSPVELGPSGSVDMVLTFRNTHNWIGDGGERQAFAAFYDVLRPGGVLGVVQHRADEGVDPKASAKDGYVPESYVIEIAKEAGFELIGRSDINRNPKDGHRHPAGVWTLPPVLRLGDESRSTYEAIGESDRMTLKFKKPGARS